MKCQHLIKQSGVCTENDDAGIVWCHSRVCTIKDQARPKHVQNLLAHGADLHGRREYIEALRAAEGRDSALLAWDEYKRQRNDQ